MAKKQLLHTPEGVRDIYGVEYSRKKTLEAGINKVMTSYGYNGIQTPVLEFFDIFKKERGSVVSAQMFKLFDSENNTIVMRPDMTPAIVRCVSKYYTPADLPVRLSFCGNTFINDRSYRLRLNECNDAGIELFGDDSVEADAEIIACMVDCLKECGLENFQISLGNALFLDGLFEEIAFDEDTVDEIRQCLISKNLFALESILKKENLTERQLEIFKRLSIYSGTIEQITEVETLLRNDKSKSAIARLKDLYRILGYYDMQKYISFDLGLTTGYLYYTGIVFAAYTYGTGAQIVSGGRYDTLMSQFSYDAAAIGFKISIDGVMTALSRQNIDVEAPMVDHLMLMGDETMEENIRLAAKLREKGTKLALMKADKHIEEYLDYAKAHSFKQVLQMNRSCTTMTILEVEDGRKTTLELADFLYEEA